MPSPRRTFCATLLVAWFMTSSAAALNDTFLYVIPVEKQALNAATSGAGPEVTLHVSDGGRGAVLIQNGGALELIDSEDDRLTVSLSTHPTLEAAPEAAHLAPTFVVDFNEEPVTLALAQLQESVGSTPTPTEISNFVAGYIVNKTYQGTFELASWVAANRIGDCTEHAVLLTALARATGKPARILVGVVLIETAIGISAFGHAWSEIYDGTSWQLRDATRPEVAPGVIRVRYLPFIALENEGPGYMLDLTRIFAVQPSKIVIAGASIL